MQDSFFNKSEASWITEKLNHEIKSIFEPRYKRKLADKEILQIAENLSKVVEEILKLKWRKKYEHAIPRS